MKINQTGLLDKSARYCIDTNVISSFIKNDEEEWYSYGFDAQWNFIENNMQRRVIVAPLEVQKELSSLFGSRSLQLKPYAKDWLKKHAYIFIDKDDEQLSVAALIVNKYQAYGQSANMTADLMIMSLAKAMHLTVVTLEERATTHSAKKPKDPQCM